MAKAEPTPEGPKSTAKSDIKKTAQLVERARARSKHKFTVSHRRDDDFDQGLRTYAKYRDLGIAAATGGMVRAHVIRFIPPFRPEFEGEGIHTEAGSCGLQPPRIKHTVLGYSDDCELLEIVIPADFETVTVPNPERREMPLR